MENDFEVNENGEALGTGNDARLARMALIADSADREREDEFMDIVDIDKGLTEKFVAPHLEEDEEAKAVREDEESEAARNAAAVAAEAREAAAAGQAPVLPRLKVNGVDTELTPELIAKAQKIASADVYLSEAARLRTDLAGRQAQVAAPVNAQQGEDLVALARAIQMGSEEEAVEAIRKLQKAGPSQDDIARTVDERVLFNSALSQFRTNYADITGDPILNRLALDADDRLVKSGDTRPYHERYTAIGNELRAWVNGKTGAAQAAPVAAQADKTARKAAASGAPVTASAKTSSSVQEEKEESVSDVIAQMAAKRGGPQWMTSMGKV